MFMNSINDAIDAVGGLETVSPSAFDAQAWLASHAPTAHDIGTLEEQYNVLPRR